MWTPVRVPDLPESRTSGTRAGRAGPTRSHAGCLASRVASPSRCALLSFCVAYAFICSMPVLMAFATVCCAACDTAARASATSRVLMRSNSRSSKASKLLPPSRASRRAALSSRACALLITMSPSPGSKQKRPRASRHWPCLSPDSWRYFIRAR